VVETRGVASLSSVRIDLISCRAVCAGTRRPVGWRVCVSRRLIRDTQGSARFTRAVFNVMQSLFRANHQPVTSCDKLERWRRQRVGQRGEGGEREGKEGGWSLLVVTRVTRRMQEAQEEAKESVTWDGAGGQGETRRREMPGGRNVTRWLAPKQQSVWIKGGAPVGSDRSGPVHVKG
jgi:hypothetical protein